MIFSGKPVPTFRDHALTVAQRRERTPGSVIETSLRATHLRSLRELRCVWSRRPAYARYASYGGFGVRRSAERVGGSAEREGGSGGSNPGQRVTPWIASSPLLPRTRSSHSVAASPIANFGFKRQ